jgi:predicted enzyme related to lactoylglutathione lyase
LLACAVAGVSCAWALPAPPFELPPIGGATSGEHHPGKVIWADLVTSDLEPAEQFYGGLFGWTFQTINADYAVAALDGRPVAGLFRKTPAAGAQRHTAWLTFMSVRDVDSASRVAESHGAKIMAQAKTYPGRGRQAVLADPQGAVFALLAAASGDPPDVLAEPGEWIWSSLLATDPGQSAAFYKSVFGYEVFDMPSDDGAAHIILSSDDYARAGIHSLPAGHRHPHWLDFIRVIDAEASAAKAASLGGRILVEPYVDRHGGKIAVVSDPEGAPVGLMEWSDTDSRAEPR